MNDADPIIDARALSRLQWSCRRGLLENDLIIQRFFDSHAPGLTLRQARGLQHLMDLSDPDLLALDLQGEGQGDGLFGAALCRKHPPMTSTVIELPQALDRPEVRDVLGLLRRPSPMTPIEGMTP